MVNPGFFSRCVIISLCLHLALFSIYQLLTITFRTVDTDDIIMQNVDVDFQDIPFELKQAKAKSKAHKNEWIEGKGKGKNSEFEPVDDRPSGNDDTDEDGYYYSFKGDSPPKAIINFSLKQYYPQKARMASIQNKTVIVQIRVDEDGTLKNAKIISGEAGYGFDEAALLIIKRAKFRPGYLKGKPTKMVHKLPIQFVLE